MSAQDLVRLSRTRICAEISLRQTIRTTGHEAIRTTARPVEKLSRGNERSSRWS